MLSLFGVLSIFCGKATFRNLSRYSNYCEKSYSRWYRRKFNFVEFNAKLIRHELAEAELLGVIDASFMKKSGKCTEGLGWFYNSCNDKAERGLETSVVAVVDVRSNTAYGIDSEQTIDKVPLQGKDKEHTRVDLYVDQIKRVSAELKALNVRYLAADSYYAKAKFVNTTLKLGFDIIGKLRIDANLKWLYEGDYSGVGRPRSFDGKVRITEGLSRFDFEGRLEDGVEVYSKVVWSVNLKRKIKVVILRWGQGDLAINIQMSS